MFFVFCCLFFRIYRFQNEFSSLERFNTRLYRESCTRVDNRVLKHINGVWKSFEMHQFLFCVFQSTSLVLIELLFVCFCNCLQFLDYLCAYRIINFSNNNNNNKRYRIRSLFISKLKFPMMIFYSSFFFDSMPS